MKISYHTHTARCKHGKGCVSDYVEYASKNNFKVIGFTDHLPFSDERLAFCRMNYSEFNDYLNEIETAQKQYPNLLIYSGFEAEYFEDSKEYYQELLKKVDYLILGQHAIKKGNQYIFVDNCQSEEDLNLYVDAIEEAASTGYFSLINHPDLFGLAKETWDEVCVKITHRLANIAIKYNLPIELNAQGMRRWSRINSRPYAYPFIEFWEIIARDYPQIKIIVSSDAHSPEALNDEAVKKCIELSQSLNLNTIESLNLLNPNKPK